MLPASRSATRRGLRPASSRPRRSVFLDVDDLFRLLVGRSPFRASSSARSTNCVIHPPSRRTVIGVPTLETRFSEMSFAEVRFYSIDSRRRLRSRRRRHGARGVVSRRGAVRDGAVGIGVKCLVRRRAASGVATDGTACIALHIRAQRPRRLYSACTERPRTISPYTRRHLPDTCPVGRDAVCCPFAALVSTGTPSTGPGRASHR